MKERYYWREKVEYIGKIEGISKVSEKARESVVLSLGESISPGWKERQKEGSYGCLQVLFFYQVTCIEKNIDK